MCVRVCMCARNDMTRFHNESERRGGNSGDIVVALSSVCYGLRVLCSVVHDVFSLNVRE